MIICDRTNKRLTANQAAKVLVYKYGEGAYFWYEKGAVDWTTDREYKEICDAVDRQLDRVGKLLKQGLLYG